MCSSDLCMIPVAVAGETVVVQYVLPGRVMVAGENESVVVVDALAIGNSCVTPGAGSKLTLPA